MAHVRGTALPSHRAIWLSVAAANAPARLAAAGGRKGWRLASMHGSAAHRKLGPHNFSRSGCHLPIVAPNMALAWLKRKRLMSARSETFQSARPPPAAKANFAKHFCAFMRQGAHGDAGVADVSSGL
jgi:hypothetical protein